MWNTQENSHGGCVGSILLGSAMDGDFWHQRLQMLNKAIEIHAIKAQLLAYEMKLVVI